MSKHRERTWPARIRSSALVRQHFCTDPPDVFVAVSRWAALCSRQLDKNNTAAIGHAVPFMVASSLVCMTDVPHRRTMYQMVPHQPPGYPITRMHLFTRRKTVARSRGSTEQLAVPRASRRKTRSHPKTWFVTRSSEKAVVKAGGEKGSEACSCTSRTFFTDNADPRTSQPIAVDRGSGMASEARSTDPGQLIEGVGP